MPFQKAIDWALIALALPALWWLANPARDVVLEAQVFVPVHTAMGIVSVVLATLIFVTGYRAILSERKGALVQLGVCFLGVGLLDFLHTMSYVGLPVASSHNTPDKSMLFWLAARLLAAGALLAYTLLPASPQVSRRQKQVALVVMGLLVAFVAWVGLLRPEHVRLLVAAGQGLTGLMISVEWLVVVMNVFTLAVLWRRRAAVTKDYLQAMGTAVVLSTVSELFFTLPAVAGMEAAGLLGHFYKLIAFLYLFNATFNEALRVPLQRIKVQSQREGMILNAAPDGILWVDAKGDILLANPAMAAISGYDPTELVGQNVTIFLPEHLRQRHARSILADFSEPGVRALSEANLQLLRRDGQMLPVAITLGHWMEDGKRHAIAYIRDLTERKKFEEKLRFQAMHDELTGLPNRWLFNLQLDQALARCGRNGSGVAVVLLDLDNFKTVNDTFGHASGDALLVQVGARMRAVLRDSDTLARLGGDEFAILLSEVGSAQQVERVVNKLLQALGATYLLHGLDVTSSASVGVAMCPDNAKDSNTLMRYADLAMYRAKDGGRSSFAFFSEDMDSRMLEDLQLHNSLKDAVARGALALHYQPQVDVTTGAIVGVEALLRWFDPVLGQVSPARFIPVAEATGLILPLSAWVLDTACRQIAAWTQAGTPVRVAINVSAQQFQHLDLPGEVSAALARTGAQARWLDIEITESVAMKHPEQACEQLKALVALGCRVALDDFGTGYSSLAYLKALPVHKLKIDKSFMDGIPDDPNDVALSRAILALARGLGMSVIAEGVETLAQLAFLRESGCEAYQGWLFAKAMSADEMSRLLASQ